MKLLIISAVTFTSHFSLFPTLMRMRGKRHSLFYYQRSSAWYIKKQKFQEIFKVFLIYSQKFRFKNRFLNYGSFDADSWFSDSVPCLTSRLMGFQLSLLFAYKHIKMRSWMRTIQSMSGKWCHMQGRQFAIIRDNPTAERSSSYFSALPKIKLSSFIRMKQKYFIFYRS